MSNLTNERLEELEVKISYQERLIQELNDVIVLQQRQVDKLEESILQVREYLCREQGQRSATEREENPPPHY